MTELIPLLVAIGSLIIGSILGYFARQSIAKRQAHTAEAKIDKLVGEAKAQAQEIILKAKDKAVKALDEIKKEEVVETKANRLEEEEKELKERIEKVRAIKIELEQLKEDRIKNIEKIARLSQAQAKKELLKLIEDKN